MHRCPSANDEQVEQCSLNAGHTGLHSHDGMSPVGVGGPVSNPDPVGVHRLTATEVAASNENLITTRYRRALVENERLRAENKKLKEQIDGLLGALS